MGSRCGTHCQGFHQLENEITDVSLTPREDKGPLPGRETFLKRLVADAKVDENHHKSVKCKVTELVKFIARRIGERDNSLKCTKGKNNPQMTGSSFNSTKTGRPDEYDVVFHMDTILGVMEKMEILQDSSEFHDVRSMPGQLLDGLESCRQIKLLKGASVDRIPTGWRAFLNDDRTHLFDFISARKFRNIFDQEVKKVIEVDYEEFARRSKHLAETTVHREPHGVIKMMCPGDLFVVCIDVSPAFTFQLDDKGKQTVELVPSWNYNTWKLNNEDPAELERDVVKSAIIAVKAVRSIKEYQLSKSAGTSTSGMYPECWRGLVPYFFQSKTEGGKMHVVHLKSLSQEAEDYLLSHACRPSSTLLPSYAIVGTVVKHYRENPGIDLYDLVSKTFETFHFIDPKGDSLLISKDRKQRNIPAYLRAKDIESFCSSCRQYIQKQNDFCLPPWFLSYKKKSVGIVESNRKINDFTWSFFSEQDKTVYECPVTVHEVPARDLFSYPWFKAWMTSDQQQYGVIMIAIVTYHSMRPLMLKALVKDVEKGGSVLNFFRELSARSKLNSHSYAGIPRPPTK